MIVHFDVDQNLKPLISGRKIALPLTLKTVSRIKNKKQIDIISIKTQSVINQKILDSFPNLKLIITRTVGFDHIDLDACQKRRIAVYHIPNYGSAEVAQHTIALLLCAARRILPANQKTHQGKFSYRNFLGISLVDKTLGLIGTGKIGLEVAKIAKSLGMKIIAYDLYQNQQAAKTLGFQYVSLAFLLKNSDVITLHLPLTKKTQHFLSNQNLKTIKKGAILINTARGDLIDFNSLLKYADKFDSICLDVVDNELNFNKNHPVLKLKNCLITPHCAFYTDHSLKIIASETEENIKRFYQGEKTNRII